MITEYRALAQHARESAARAANDAVRDQFISLAKSWERLADTLAGTIGKGKG